jgi:ferrous iron transport protein B
MVFVDLPGTYSLLAHSAEEEAARDFLCFGGGDGAVVVCDATCLERNLNLVLQVLEITPRIVVCVNLLDEAARKGIQVDLEGLERSLGVPVAGTSARSGRGLEGMLCRLEQMAGQPAPGRPLGVVYPQVIEDGVSLLVPALRPAVGERLNLRWLALRLLEGDESLSRALCAYLGEDILQRPAVAEALAAAKNLLSQHGWGQRELEEAMVGAIVATAESVAAGVVCAPAQGPSEGDRRLDRLFTSRRTGIPVMLLLLAAVFWLTITGANYPSQLLSTGLFALGDWLTQGLAALGCPPWLLSPLMDGAYRVLAWVVAVMLPPMAIFFPLFTLLEDFGYLPRVAFNLDRCFQCARACGKQSLTMMMGFGCNAAGVVGCRIIDSPRERLIAIITNSFVPCNGRFPTLILLLTVFFIGGGEGFWPSVLSALGLTGVIVLGVGATLLVSRILSATILRGMPSAFALELPPYRRPQIVPVLVRSVLDRTLFVLGRAAAVAAPAGLVIWLMANITLGEATLLHHCAALLDPFARLLGMDGVILLAFILGFPANEIVIPIIIMSYLSAGSLMELESTAQLHALLVQNGWTWATAGSVILFSLMHWPCSTTCLTIRKETGSWKWTAVSLLVPTLGGMLLCFLFTAAVRLLGLV